ncbi:MAG: FecR domain-containing protein [Verrucomicrobiales bacterium]|nr:FecR domain-containing protein [Verrucomicrobiales bacterium]
MNPLIRPFFLPTFRAAFLSAFLLLTAFSPAPAQEEKAPGTATLVVGAATYEAPGGVAPVELKQGDLIAVGGKVTTGPGAKVVILTSRQSAVRVGADTTLVFEEMEETPAGGGKPKVRLQLSSGSLGAMINSKDFGEMDFSVKTPHGVAAARGTFFAVAISGDRSFAQVGEGVVEIQAADGGSAAEN